MTYRFPGSAWWEPPLDGTEAEHVIATLDRLRVTFRWKADGLDAAGLNQKISTSQLTLGGLLKHLAVVEDEVSTVRLTGDPIGEPWQTMLTERPDDDWWFTSAADDSPETLYRLYDEAVARGRGRVAAALDSGGLDHPVAMGDGEGHHSNLRRLLHDLTEEYGRHTGHADLLREAVDGRVGEDPPAEFMPNWPEKPR